MSSEKNRDTEKEKERSLRYFAAAHRKIQRYSRLPRQTAQRVFGQMHHICSYRQTDGRMDRTTYILIYHGYIYRIFFFSWENYNTLTMLHTC